MDFVIGECFSRAVSDYALRLIRPTGCITVTSVKPHGLELEESIAVVLQFGDGILDVVKR